MKDKYLNCIQCEKPFLLAGTEQERLLSRGFGFPRRCPDCRRKKQKNVSGSHDEWRLKGKRWHGRGKKTFWEE